MPLPKAKTVRAKDRSTKAADQKRLETKVDGLSGVWCVGGDILNLAGWRTDRYKETDTDLIIFASITAENVLTCKCGVPSAKLQRWGFTSPTYIYDLPVRGKRTRIYFQQRRYRCPCGSTLQQLPPSVDEGRRITSRLSHYIKHEAFNIYKTFVDLANEVGVSEKLVRDIFTERAEQLEKKRVIETPRWLAIDEVHAGKKEYCVITDPICQQVLDILPNNFQPTLSKWLLQLPNRRQVEVVTIDMWRSYLGAVHQVLSQAQVVVDRYHVHNLLNTAIKDVLQVLRDCMPATKQRKYMRDPRLLLKSRFSLSDETTVGGTKEGKPSEKDVVTKWLKDVPELGKAYWLKEGLSDILQLTDRAKAEERLDEWLEEAWVFVKYFRAIYEKQYGGKWNEPFGNVVTTVSQWRIMILNYIDCKHRFERKVTNSFAEYANKEIKKAYLLGNGYTYEVLRSKIIHGGLLVRRRPPHPLDEKPLVKKKPRATKRGKKNLHKINPEANVVRLERVREERDETRNLFAKPQEDKAWSARFRQLNQPQSDLNADQDVWEPPKKGSKRRRREKDEQPKPNKRARLPRLRNRDQLKMF